MGTIGDLVPRMQSALEQKVIEKAERFSGVPAKISHSQKLGFGIYLTRTNGASNVKVKLQTSDGYAISVDNKAYPPKKFAFSYTTGEKITVANYNLEKVVEDVGHHRGEKKAGKKQQQKTLHMSGGTKTHKKGNHTAAVRTH